jgi:surface antigen
LIKKPGAEVQEAKKQGIGLSGHIMVNAAIERHTATLYQATWTNIFLAQMAPQTIFKHTGDGKEHRHIHLSDAGS